ncbi:LuxR family transcriptional regulator [Ruegeria sp. EL01]|uniref:helix-turn-helix transcriptional regulator n=1 Tax=Ruegeria sp. EL01 TaxID=2107578 RepID=UPI0013C45766|nr:LuxR family transcriptional regulator [Ruegeria sp. EL01]
MQTGAISEYFVENCERFQLSNCDSAFLSELAEKFGFSNITYFFLSNKTVTGSPGRLLTTYAEDWQSHYFSMNYDEIDPIVWAGMRSFLPINWAMVPRPTKKAQKFFGEAMEFGISDQGVTIPVRGASGETALVSLSPEVGQSDWSAYLKDAKSDVIYFAYLLHKAVLNTTSQPRAFETAHLTEREKDALQCAALGKTSKDTAVVLEISERTVEAYLANAAAKLQACTKTQAVARAISAGYIQPDPFIQVLDPSLKKVLN